jgi:hypothetical protein
MRRKTVSLDFDGVLHAYSRGWSGGACYDVPVNGTADALAKLHERFRLVVTTAREAHTHEEVWDWLEQHKLAGYIDQVSNTKPPAAYYIDDRAIRFTGSWDDALAEVDRLEESDSWKPLAPSDWDKQMDAINRDRPMTP